MKKRLIFIVLAVLLALTLCVTLAACDDALKKQIDDLQNKVNGYEADLSEKTITVYIGDGEDSRHTVTTRKSFFIDVLREMKDKPECLV